MSVHLFPGSQEGDEVVVTLGITLCCGIHTLGLSKGDQGTLSVAAVTCSSFEPTQAQLKELYPTVDTFADRMRAELWRNRAHGDRPAWLSMSPKHLHFELSWHLGKLHAPLVRFDRDAIVEHAADIGNAAMFAMDYADQGVAWSD